LDPTDTAHLFATSTSVEETEASRAGGVPGGGGPTGGARPPTPTAARLDLRAASTSSDNIFDVGSGHARDRALPLRWRRLRLALVGGHGVRAGL